MKERSTHDKCLINKCLSNNSVLSDMVAHTFVIQKLIVRGVEEERHSTSP